MTLLRAATVIIARVFSFVYNRSNRLHAMADRSAIIERMPRVISEIDWLQRTKKTFVPFE